MWCSRDQCELLTGKEILSCKEDRELKGIETVLYVARNLSMNSTFECAFFAQMDTAHIFKQGLVQVFWNTFTIYTWAMILLQKQAGGDVWSTAWHNFTECRHLATVQKRSRVNLEDHFVSALTLTCTSAEAAWLTVEKHCFILRNRAAGSPQMWCRPLLKCFQSVCSAKLRPG